MKEIIQPMENQYQEATVVVHNQISSIPSIKVSFKHYKNNKIGYFEGLALSVKTGDN